MNQTTLVINSTTVQNFEYFITATSKGGRTSQPVHIKLGICANNSLSAVSSSSVNEVIERFSTNVYDRDLQNTHIIDHWSWSKFFENDCFLCQPTYSIVDSNFNETSGPVWVDEDDHIRIKTTEGLRFRGYIKAGYSSVDDQSCARVN